MGPFMVIFIGMSLVTVPEAARVLRRSPRHLPLFCVLVSGARCCWAGVGGRAAGGAAERARELAAGPDLAADLPAGAAADDFRHGRVRHVGATAGLHALGAATEPARKILGSVGLSSPVRWLGALSGGAVGAVRGAAVATGLARWCGGGSCTRRCGNLSICPCWFATEVGHLSRAASACQSEAGPQPAACGWRLRRLPEDRAVRG